MTVLTKQTRRKLDRWIHIPSGRVYNLSYNPPRVPGLDDVTGEPLSKRPDDTPEVFKVRLDQHHAMAMPLLDHYQHVVVNVQGNTSDEIYPQIESEIVNRLGALPGNMQDSFSIASMRQRFQQSASFVEVEEERMAAGASI
jgi:adenylate kinase